MSELDDKVDAIVAGVQTTADKLTDFKTDFDAAIAKLQADIAAGGNTSAAIAKLTALSTQLGTINDALTALDATAEGISGTPTP